MRRRLAILALSAATLMLIPFSASADALSGGCAAFGANVAALADQGAEFGALASSVARLDLQASFPTIVVHPEQEEFCS